MVKHQLPEYSHKPQYTKEEIEELTRFTFWESFGESLVTFGAYFMVVLLSFLFMYSIIIEN
jgi:hypothetical protein